MRAMLLRRVAPVAERPLQPTDLPVPQPAAGEILLRISVCAVCRTDLHVIEGDLPSKRLPLVPGHMIVGNVEQLGAGCSRFAPGERVGVAAETRKAGGESADATERPSRSVSHSEPSA